MKRLICLLFGYCLIGGILHASATYGGDGCPAGTANVVSNQDGSFRLVFDSFDLTASRVTTGRKSCNIAIPIEVPPGYSVNFGQVSIQGLYDIKSGTSATIESEAFFAGGSGPVYNRVFNGEAGGAIDIKFTPSPAWFACGRSPTMRLNTSVVLKTSKPDQGNSVVKIMEISLGKPMLRRCS